MAGFCNQCHQPIQNKDFKMVKGRKVCGSCLRSQDQQKQEAILNDKGKEGLFSFLISSFNIGKIPESWYNSVDGMLKKGFSCKGIENTIKYCQSKGKYVTEENWTGLIYVFYQETQEEVQRQQELQKRNEKFIISKEVVVVNKSTTSYRDKPKYNIEDL